MMQKTALCAALGLVLVVPGCRNDGATSGPDGAIGMDMDTEDAPDASTGASEDTLDLLQGTWTSEACESDGTNAFRRTFSFSGDRWEIAFVTYGDAECTPEMALIQFDFGGVVEIDDPSDAVDGALDAFFGFSSRTITPVSDAAAAFLNDGSACGSADWQTGTARDVQTDGCPDFGVLPADACAGEFDLVALEEQTLRLGTRPADNNLCTDELRPTSLGDALVRMQ